MHELHTHTHREGLKNLGSSRTLFTGGHFFESAARELKPIGVPPTDTCFTLLHTHLQCSEWGKDFPPAFSRIAREREWERLYFNPKMNAFGNFVCAFILIGLICLWEILRYVYFCPRWRWEWIAAGTRSKRGWWKKGKGKSLYFGWMDRSNEAQ